MITFILENVNPLNSSQTGRPFLQNRKFLGNVGDLVGRLISWFTVSNRNEYHRSWFRSNLSVKLLLKNVELPKS